MKKYNICVIKGDGIGPEIVDEAIKVLDSVSEKFEFELNYEYALLGGEAIDVFSTPLPNETFEIIKRNDAVLLGVVGGQKWDNLANHLEPKKALIKLRRDLDCDVSLMHICSFDGVKNRLNKELISLDNLDILLIRCVKGGIYFSEPKQKDEFEAKDTMCYTKQEIKTAVDFAFLQASKRRKKVTLIGKFDMLETSKFWQEITKDALKDYPDITLEFLNIDEAVNFMANNPEKFDVLLCGAFFGDIVCSYLSTISGTKAFIPRADFSKDVKIFEPIHGCVDEISGQGIANPIAAILASAMMLKYAFGEVEASECIQNAVKKALQDGYVTKDLIFNDNTKEICSTSELGSIISGYASK